MTELDQLHYDDLMADLSMAITQYGARKVLQDFNAAYPALYHELLQQMMFQRTRQRVPALFQKPEDSM